MSVLKTWTGGAFLLLAMAGGLRAEVTVSQSNDPAASVDLGLVTLLGQERSALESVAPKRISAITTAPRPAQSQGAPVVVTAEWLAAQPVPTGGPELQCLTEALYHEARGETLQGQVAVAEVILNRVQDVSFPSSVCGVVNQGNGQGCQFSYTCDGKTDQMREAGAPARAAKIAKVMLDGAPRKLTDGATYFHTPAVNPSWSKRFTRTTQIGSHIFYRPPVRTAQK
jgi:spore germination cell wall hydrolase CwlJ-like protein